MEQTDLKIYLFNTIAFFTSFANVEMWLQIILLITTIIYTIQRIIKNDKKISKHISYKEATKSITAIRLGINNTPNSNALSNMIKIATKIFEPLRKWVEGPIKNKFFL